MISDTKVVAIGGGTGLSTMLKGLKLHTHNITAVVTVHREYLEVTSVCLHPVT